MFEYRHDFNHIQKDATRIRYLCRQTGGLHHALLR